MAQTPDIKSTSSVKNFTFRSPEFSETKFVLMDVEGTTSDIRFVKEVLFPYSAREMRNFLSVNKANPHVRELVNTVVAGLDKKADAPGDAALQQLLEWIRQDVKHPVLKELQGMIWRQGYETGVFKAPLYADVLPSWRVWSDARLRLGIYSSGSVAAQKLFYKYTEQGDVLAFLETHFDLAVGGKNQATSYRAIADDLHLPGHEILFLSDRSEELVAAREAGLQAAHIVRPGTAEVPDFKAYVSFKNL